MIFKRMIHTVFLKEGISNSFLDRLVLSNVRYTVAIYIGISKSSFPLFALKIMLSSIASKVCLFALLSQLR